MQMRKLNKMQNYERNCLWKSFNSISCRCIYDDENWDKILLCLIYYEWLVERT